MTFADVGHAGNSKQTRRELFLGEMDQVVPWTGVDLLTDPHFPNGEGGRQAYPLRAMLRVQLMQRYGYSDPATEKALYETIVLRQTTLWLPRRASSAWPARHMRGVRSSTR